MKKILLCLMVMLIWSFPYTAFGEEQIDTGSITIIGDGVEKEIVISAEELAGLPKVTGYFSSSNNFPTSKITYAEGVLLEDVLAKASLKANATIITVTSSDGYTKTFTKEELMDSDRYYFPNMAEANEANKVKVKAMIAIKAAEGQDPLEAIQPWLLMGQRTIMEQNNPWFVKYVAKIQVSTASLQKWEAPVADPSSGVFPTTREVRLVHKQLDSVKIYYTVDGSDPTINSKLYNVSASYYQPTLNVPVKIDKNTTLKAMAIGTGKKNSDISTFSYKIGNLESNGQFNDLQGYEWAEKSINNLLKVGVIKGVSSDRFNPSGTLSRGQFAKLMVLSLGKKPMAYQGEFSDVKTGAWYADYVETAYQLEILKGTGDGKFQPEAPLTKEEMLAVIVRAEQQEGEMSSLNTTALSMENISDWAKPAVISAERGNLIEHGNMTVWRGNYWILDGKAYANRAEAGETVNRLLTFLAMP